ncbi:sensor domain-containing diguanylate cyclase [Mesobacillus subterraneus]|uniref:sensor domain-containing diguanylate cyclase n=1 Tax=Mesobacillus subterraneus TaxID=285983 RepID=UPI001CFE8BB9|nr:sensor domain-containing diguanylate cyclase [Mesobacillus subterraneus]WLR56177.1 sensor domain-containing diguanylate cyclase [Mesobacillus subterraneus]
MISSVIKKSIWFAWLLIVPVGIWITYQVYPPAQVSIWEVIPFIILMSVVAAMPLVVNNTPIFLIQWVSLAVFLKYGIFIEMVLMQVSVLILLIRIRVPKADVHKFPLNSLMFFFVSLFSGMLFYALGGTHGEQLSSDPYYLFLGAVYGISNFGINTFILVSIQALLFKLEGPYFGKDFIWETVTTLITFPIGFVLYELSKDMGPIALLFVGIPFASLSIILGLYYSSDKVNQFLQSAAEIGHQLAERLKSDDVLDLFVQKLIEMLPVDYAYILDVEEDRELILIHKVEFGEVLDPVSERLEKGKGISGLVWEEKKPVLFHSKKQWKHINSGYIPAGAESILGVPIVRNNQVIGVLVLAANKKRAFEKSQLMIIDILCSHFAVAVENARHHEKTKENSERCALTGLYNYRYFENMLTAEFEKLQFGHRNLLSLILLDIDHFKSVNDTYGHQSGNEILIELGERLRKRIGGIGTVARYGGEEFVILLPETMKGDALKLAEQIRLLIANEPFTLLQSMDEEGKQLLVNITASIGVATAPQDADDSLALIRHADRALYVGAKRSGRNRVAEYVK